MPPFSFSSCRILLRSSSCSSTAHRHLPHYARPFSSSSAAASSSSTHPPHVVPLAHSAAFPKRTHTCGALSAAHADANVVLAGWILPQRKISSVRTFFPLRDSYGTTQLVATRETPQSSALLDALSVVPVESVVLVQGAVRLRPQNARRNTEATGEVEVLIHDFTLLNPADHRHMPFLPCDTRNLANDELRARYRNLDLRRRPLTENLRKRSAVAHLIRNVLHDEGFTEVETPILLKSTPEGAREFLVPTRIALARPSEDDSSSRTTTTPSNSPADPAAPASSSSPAFYALPQSPQQPKQLLICSGAIDRYYQIARCFRDEDGRKDRQPEFTQIDLEMAFVSWGDVDAGAVRLQEEGQQAPTASATDTPEPAPNDPNPNPDPGLAPDVATPPPPPPSGQWRIGGHEVRDVTEALVRRIWADVEGIALPPRFPVMTYQDAMGRFGSDKPDTRFGLEIDDMTALLPPALRDACHEAGQLVEGLVVPGDSPFAKSSVHLVRSGNRDHVNVQGHHITNSNLSNWLRHNKVVQGDPLADDTLDPTLLNEHLQLKPGDSIWLSRRKAVAEGGSTSLGRFRLALAQHAQTHEAWAPPGAPHFLWVTEFPLFTHADGEKAELARGRWASTHHPFTAPVAEDVDKLFAGEIESVRGQHYDLVLNGVEIGGGSVRVHDAAMQEFIFSVLQLTETETTSFAHLLHALRCGAPPHGGIALGFDRLMAILCRTETIRDVIAFPKTGAGTDTFFKSPSLVSDGVLRQYGIVQAR